MTWHKGNLYANFDSLRDFTTAYAEIRALLQYNYAITIQQKESSARESHGKISNTNKVINALIILY